ncbi:hypothetical protein [Archangium violaceum]|uniref:hypothetical protein n=1 Tax=Archangium violaceum TaxID=83451 RepID=UPI0036D9B118
MAEEKAGYIICRTDAEAMEECYRQALEFLGSEEIEDSPVDPAGWSLTFATRSDSSVMRVSILLPPEVEERGGYVEWIENNHALPSMFAEALDCDVFAFCVAPRIGYEYAEWYSPDGSEEAWHDSGDEDADPEASPPVTRVASMLEVSRDFLLQSLEGGSPPFEQRLDARLNKAGIKKYLRTLSPMPRPPPAADDANVIIRLPQSVVDEASALAAREGTSLSTVICQRFDQAIPRLREDLRTEHAELARRVAGPEKDELVKCQVHMPMPMQQQLVELVKLSDRPPSWLLAAAFRLGQAPE